MLIVRTPFFESIYLALTLIYVLFFQEYDGVSLGTSKTEKGFVQMVLTDDENGI